MLWARESNSYRSRGSLHGSRYSRSGATRKGEKAMAGQRKNPTTGAVTVSEPTDRQTPKRAGGAVVNNPRKSGTPVGSGSRSKQSAVISSLRGVMRDAFLKADRRGSHASGSTLVPLCASLSAACGCSVRALACLALFCPLSIKLLLLFSSEWGSPFRGSSW